MVDAAISVNPDGTLTIAGRATAASSVTVIYPDGTRQNVLADATGHFSATSSDPQTSGAVSVSATDASGHTSTPLELTYTDVTAPGQPGLSIVEDLNHDGQLSLAEISAPTLQVKVSLNGTGAMVGDQIVLSDLRTHTLSAEDLATGYVLFEFTVPRGGQTFKVEAHLSDAAGNVSPSASSEVLISPDFTGITVDQLSRVNIAEIVSNGLSVTGTLSQYTAHETISVTLLGKTVQATVLADGSWHAYFSAGSYLAGCKNSTPVQFTLSDSLTGQEHAGSSTLGSGVDMLPATIALNRISGDNVLSHAELAQEIVISGSTTNTQAGDLVTITIGSFSFQTAVNAQGLWSYTVPSGTLTGLSNQDYRVSASIERHDASGNPLGSSTSTDVTVDASLPSLTLDPLPGGNILGQSATVGDYLISGSGTPFEQVVVQIGAGSFFATVDQHGHWEIQLAPVVFAALQDGSYTLSASITRQDSSGNVMKAEASLDFTLKQTPPRLEDLTIVTHADGTVTVSGKALDGATKVTVNFLDGAHSIVIDSDGDGSFSITSIASQPSGTITVKATDNADNLASSDLSYTDLIAPGQPTVQVLTDTNHDGLISIEELNGATTLMLRITLNGTHAMVGDTLSLSGLPTHTLTVIEIQQGYIDVQVPAPAADQAFHVSAVLTDKEGNASSAGSADVTMATTPATVTVDQITKLNYQTVETEGLTLNGRVTGSYSSNDTVYVTVLGTTLSTHVNADGTWHVTFSGAQMNGIKNGTPVTLRFDEQLNHTDLIVSDLTVGSGTDYAPPVVSIDPLFVNGILSWDESKGDGLVTGKVYGISQPGDRIELTLDNGQTYIGTVKADQTWSILIPANDLGSMRDGDHNVTVKVFASDPAGNLFETNVNNSFSVDLTPPTFALAFFPLPFGETLNLIETFSSFSISGTSTGLPEGTEVTVRIGGYSYTAFIGADRSWSITPTTFDLQRLPDGSASISVSASVFGQSVHGQTTFNVDLTPPELSELSYKVNADHSITLSGMSEAGASIFIIFEGSAYKGTANSAGYYEIRTPPNMGSSSGIATLTATDAAGNVTSGSYNYDIDLTPPELSELSYKVNADRSITLSGMSEAYAGILIIFDGRAFMGTANSAGYYEIKTPPNMGSSSGPATLTATDAAGNVTSGSYYIDLTPPAAPQLKVLENTNSDAYINNAEMGSATVITVKISLAGTGAQAGDKLNLAGHAPYELSSSDITQGYVSLQIPRPTDDGAFTVKATLQDAVGNVSNESNLDLIMATSKPVASMEIHYTPGQPQINGLMVSGQVIGAHLSATQVVTVTILGMDAQVSIDPDTGNWSVVFPAKLFAGMSISTVNNISVQISVIDSAGNGFDAQTTIISGGLPLPVQALADDAAMSVNAASFAETEPLARHSASISETELAAPAAPIAPLHDETALFVRSAADSTAAPAMLSSELIAATETAHPALHVAPRMSAFAQEMPSHEAAIPAHATRPGLHELLSPAPTSHPSAELLADAAASPGAALAEPRLKPPHATHEAQAADETQAATPSLAASITLADVAPEHAQATPDVVNFPDAAAPPVHHDDLATLLANHPLNVV
ncbi:Ig-like domain-containing protein [Paraburkholderia bonniea]|uniref:Ig-like domain-containing protein n=1 Tax=Paraburkholderia bonniea TaxID=2152891 RepID=UPI001580B06C|nr:Ig-like domain-containing protein [Paraburkholderia bonniea]